MDDSPSGWRFRDSLSKSLVEAFTGVIIQNTVRIFQNPLVFGKIILLKHWFFSSLLSNLSNVVSLKVLEESLHSLVVALSLLLRGLVILVHQGSVLDDLLESHSEIVSWQENEAPQRSHEELQIQSLVDVGSQTVGFDVPLQGLTPMEVTKGNLHPSVDLLKISVEESWSADLLTAFLVVDLPSTGEIRIVETAEIMEITYEVFEDLSNDQKYAYLIYRVIVTGSVKSWERVINLNIGPMSKCRWLTTATRFLRLWISDKESRSLDEEEEANLKLVVEFIVKVYLPSWFYIKQNSKFYLGPGNLLHYLKLLSYWERSDELSDIIIKSLSNNSYWGAPDKILGFLLSSEHQSDQETAVNIILGIWRGNEFGNKNPNLYKITYGVNKENNCKPVINIGANSVLEMIPLSDYKIEPIFTVDMTRSQLLELINSKLTLANVDRHTQQVEHLIWRLTEASSIYWNTARRDSHIPAQQVVSKRLPKIKSKRDYIGFLPTLKKSKSL